jgi:hypothetical protein
LTGITSDQSMSVDLASTRDGGSGDTGHMRSRRQPR